MSWQDQQRTIVSLIALGMFALLTVATAAPISSNDYFWHLAAGRWMAENGALPLTDPLALASSRDPWINGEWLFQVLLYAVHRVVGDDGIALIRALSIAGFFAALYSMLAARVTRLTAFAVAFFAWYGAVPWLKERPSALGALCLAVLIFMLGKPFRGRAAAIALLVAVWVNVHPSALLAPAVVLAYAGARALERRDTGRSALLDLAAMTGAATAALFVNPFGLQGVINPFHVARIAQLPIFSNEEWARTSLREDPLFVIALAACIAIVAFTARRENWLPTATILAGVILLALLFVRNHSLFYTSAPLLLAPHVRSIPQRLGRILLAPLLVTAAAIIANADFAIGINEARFPAHATARVRALGTKGSIASTYGMGGFLVWSFYPERRVLIDGRNELFADYQSDYLHARRSSAGWDGFLQKWGVGVVFVPRGAAPVWTRDPESGKRQPATEWDLYHPESRWALIALDRAAAVFALRTPANQTAIAGGEMPRELLKSWAPRPK